VRRTSPPDGGWGWVVVFASFMINMIADGVAMSFGLLFVDLIEYFDEGKGKTAWVGSLFLSMPLLTGPIASSLTDRYGCRRVCIVGALMAAGGFVASYFSTSLEFLFLTFSVSGFGLALCYVASIVIVAYYFERRRSLATGLAVCGTGIGTFVFAPLTIYLLETFAWRGTLLILAGFFLNMVIFGLLMRDFDPFTEEAEVVLDSMDVTLFRNGRYTLLCVSNFLLNSCVDNPYVYIPDSAITLGVDKERASFLISFIGILNTLGVVIVGYLGDKTWMEPSLLYSFLTVVSGAAVGVLPLVSGYAAMAMLSAVYGFAISANYTLVPIILVELISLDNFTGAYGLLLLIQGLAGLMGPPIAGWLCDTTGAYDATFYFSGLCILASGVLMLPVASSLHCRNPSTLADDESASTSSPANTAAAKRSNPGTKVV
ncbi:monocarboxylate transporter, putative, partial [Ixodes scapularis]